MYCHRLVMQYIHTGLQQECICRKESNRPDAAIFRLITSLSQDIIFVRVHGAQYHNVILN